MLNLLNPHWIETWLILKLDFQGFRPNLSNENFFDRFVGEISDEIRCYSNW